MTSLRGIRDALKRHPRRTAAVGAGLLAFLLAGGASSRPTIREEDGLEPDLLIVRFFSQAASGDEGPSVALDDLGRIRFPADGPAGGEAEEVEDAAGEQEAAAPAPAARHARVAYRTHEVRKGETLGGLAARYGIRIETLRSTNPDAAARSLRVGQRIRVPDRDGAGHKVRRGESLWEISRAYKVPVAEIVEANGLSSAAAIRVGQTVFVPGARAAIALPRGLAWSWPAGGALSSRYGLRRHPVYGRYIFHRGVDFRAPPGSPIRAARDGVVVFAGWKGGYGRMIDVRHADGSVSRYAHASRLDVRSGTRVAKGQTIGRVGSSGTTTGPHLHFEIRRQGRTVDPLPILRGS